MSDEIVRHMGSMTYAVWRSRFKKCPLKLRIPIHDSSGEIETRIDARGEAVPRYRRTKCAHREGRRDDLCVYTNCPYIDAIESKEY